MDSARGRLSDLGDTSKRLARDFIAVGSNRLELLMVELQEERERLFFATLLVVTMSLFGLLAGITFSFAIVVLLWDVSPVGALAGLTLIYAGISFFCYRRLSQLRADWISFAATLDQMRKDRECFQQRLE